MPAVVVTGARQTGKSTLVQALAPAGRSYRSLDDLDVIDAARRDPDALVGGDRPVTLDEVQRAPELLLAVKRAIDRRRRPGRFVLTGSANLLLMQRVSESLAGRASYLTLWPMTRREQRGLGRRGAWEALLGAPDRSWLDLLAAEPDAREDWRAAARRGGFPVPAAHLDADAERAVWFDGYVRTCLERDLQVLSSIAALPDFRRLIPARPGADLGHGVPGPQPRAGDQDAGGDEVPGELPAVAERLGEQPRRIRVLGEVPLGRLVVLGRALHDPGVLDRAARRRRKTERQQGEAEDRLPYRVRRPAQAGEGIQARPAAHRSTIRDRSIVRTNRARRSSAGSTRAPNFARSRAAISISGVSPSHALHMKAPTSSSRMR